MVRYHPISRYLHWITAIMVYSVFGLALYFDGMPKGPEKFALVDYHKWFGLTVLVLVIIRLLWRLRQKVPATSATMHAWEKKIAQAIHHLLYIMMLLIPLAGWAMSSAKGYSVSFFGWVTLPALVDKDIDLAKLFKEIHEVGGWGLIIVAALHALSALKHHFINKDDILRRML